MSFHPIRDIILAFLAGCLGFAAKGQGPVGVGSGVAASSFHLWYVGQLPGGGWGVPQHIGDSVNIDSSSNYGPSVSAKGTLYWCSRNRHGNEGMQGYYAVWLGDHYAPPKLLKVPGAGSGNFLMVPIRLPDGM